MCQSSKMQYNEYFRMQKQSGPNWTDDTLYYTKPNTVIDDDH